MRFQVIFSLLLAGTQLGCSRDFTAPAPSPEITSFAPQMGFMGASLVISGINFSDVTGGNLVFFGPVSAKVISDGETSIEVEVPELQAGEEVYVTVTTAEGLATSPGKFRYKGPGHPLQEQLHSTIGVPAGPLAVTPGRFRNGLPPPTFVADSWSHSIGLFDLEQGIHADVGVADAPFSIARGLGPDGQPESFVTTLRSGAGSDLPTRLQSFAFNRGDNIQFMSPVDVELPVLAGEPFLPGYLWSYCADADCLSTRLVVFDLYRPALALFDPANPGPKNLIYIDDPGLLCPEKPDDARPFGDLVRYAPESGSPSLLVILAGQPEIWSLPEGAECASRLWARDSSPNSKFSALALCRSGSRLYVADSATPEVLGFAIDDVGLGPSLEANPQHIPLYGTPFAMGCGLLKDDSNEPVERLYVATDEGIQVMAIDATFDGPDNSPPITAFLDIGPLQGGPQSLVRIINQVKDNSTGDVTNMGDSMVFADLMHDRLLVIPAGYESSSTWQMPVSGPVPYIAPSRFDDMLYLADSFSNVLSLIDKNTGVYASQFLVNDLNSFGAADIATATLSKTAEALLVPLPPDPSGGGSGCDGFDRLIVRLAIDQGALGAWHDDWIENGYTQPSVDKAEVDSHGCFDEMLPAPRFNSVLLVRYGDGGKIWSMGLADNADKPEGLIGIDMGLKLQIDFEGPERLVRLSPFQDVLAILNGSTAVQPGVKFIWLEGPDESPSIPLDAYSALFTSDLAVKLDSDQNPVVYLALPNLGEVVAMRAGVDPYVISTAGSPLRLFFSPDGRRLYATQPQEGRISIIDSGCQPSVGCERVLDNLDVGDYPDHVVFHPSGGQAYVTHLARNQISIIE